MKSLKIKQSTNEEKQPSLLEARSTRKLRMLMKANENAKNHFIEHNDEEYIIFDKQDYSDLEKWKKNLILRENEDVSDNLKMKFKHIQSIKEDILTPELNFEIVDSVMNPKYYEDDFDYNSIPTEINMNIEKESLDMQQSQKNTMQINSEHQTIRRSSFSQKNLAHEDFSDFIIERKLISEKEIQEKKNEAPNEKKVNQNSPSASPKPQNSKFPISRVNNQSSIFLQRNLNKQLLNNLLLSRITKKYQSNQTDNTQEEENGSRKRKVTIDTKVVGQSFYQQENKQKNQSLDIVRHLFSEETEKFQKTTLNSFKNVGAQFFRLGNVIEYETLLKDILNTIYHPQGILNENQLEGIKGGIKFDPESFTYLEKALLDNYYNCTKEIDEVQCKIREERLFQTNITQELQNVHEEMVNQLFKIDAEEELFKNSINNANSMQLILHSTSTKMNANRFKNYVNPDLKMKQQKMEGKREELKIYFEALKKAIQQRIKSSLEKLEIMDKEILKIKQKRNTTKIILKDLYLKALKSDSHYSSQSLVWIIKSLININEDMTNTNIFPSILDDTSKQFLVQWAKLLIQQERIQEKIKDVNTESLNVTEQYQNIVLESSKISSLNSRDQIKQKVHRMAKGNIHLKKLSITYSSDLSTNQNFFPSYDEINNSKNTQSQERIAFDIHKLSPACIQTVELKNDMRQESLHINNLIEELKENEKLRLCRKLKSSASGYQQKLLILQSTLQSLFGKQEGDAYLNHHLKELSCFDEKINSQKFFKFTSKKSALEQQNNNNEDTLNQTKLSFLTTSVITPQQKQQKKQQDVNQIEKRPLSSQKLSLAQDIIQNFQEKKNTVIHNHQISLQYNQLSNYFFNNISSKNIIKKNNSGQPSPLLEKYFFNVNTKSRQMSEHNYNPTTISLIKSPQFAQTSSNFSSFNRQNKQRNHPTYFY